MIYQASELRIRGYTSGEEVLIMLAVKSSCITGLTASTRRLSLGW